MAVTCANCGEELMGAVNRCWRCGTEFDRAVPPDSLPPVRRAPVQLPGDVPNDGTGGVPGSGIEPGVQAASDNDQTAGPVASPQDPSATEGLRVGSPFAPTSSAADSFRPPETTVTSPLTTTSERSTAPTTTYPTGNPAAVGAAIASLVLGIFSLIWGLLRWNEFVLDSFGAFVVALLGLVMGIWGIYSDRRGVAVFGLMLCCIAMAVSGFFLTIDMYEQIFGEHPFAPSIDDSDI